MSEEIINKIRKCDMSKPFIFVSYSSKDYELVHQDVLEFQRRGYNVWLDERNLDKTKSSWKEDALKAIQHYNSILLIFYVSRYSLTSEACFNELNETVSETTKRRHKRKALDFIAVEAEPIGDMGEFTDKVDDELRRDSKNEEETEKKMDTISEITDRFFGGNNVKVRVKYKNDPSRAGKLNYYDDILLGSCDGAKNQPVQDAESTHAPAPVMTPAAPIASAATVIASAASAASPAMKKPRRERSAPVYAKPSGTVDAAMGHVSLTDIRKLFSDAEAVRAFRAVREDMPWGGKGAMDYLMAALLGGCNQVRKDSPIYQINYYLYAVASGEQKGDALGATWTWSSNCRKVLGLERSGQIPDEINRYFSSLDSSVTLYDVAVCFQKAEESPFQTLKNDLILLAAEKLNLFLANRNQ